MIGFLTRLIKQSVDSLNEDKREDNIASIKEEIDDMTGAIRCVKFSGDYYKFDWWK